MSNPLIDFLQARLAEDENNEGSEWHGYGCEVEPDTARVLREVEAKRAMLAEHGRREDCNGHPGPWMPHSDDYCVYDCWTCSQPWPCPTIKALVTVYADHPDYAALVSRI